MSVSTGLHNKTIKKRRQSCANEFFPFLSRIWLSCWCSPAELLFWFVLLNKLSLPKFIGCDVVADSLGTKVPTKSGLFVWDSDVCCCCCCCCCGTDWGNSTKLHIACSTRFTRSGSNDESASSLKFVFMVIYFIKLNVISSRSKLMESVWEDKRQNFAI